MNEYINEYINALFHALKQTQLICRNEKKYEVDEGTNCLIDLFSLHKQKQSNIFFVGNGGSAAIASHMTADFMKNGGMKTYSLYDSAMMTCMGNDYGYEYVFSRPLEFLIKEGDLLVAISSSGNSPNIVNAINVAKEKNAEVLTLTGFKEDNKAKQLGDYNLYVPSMEYGLVESIHNLILQQIVDEIMKRDGVRL